MERLEGLPSRSPQAPAGVGPTFDSLSYGNKSWHILQVEGARTDETRQRRIAKSVEMLREGRAR